MSPSAEAYTHKDFSQQLMLRPISSDSLGAGERCAGETHWIRSSENTPEHTQLLAFHLLEIHLSCILQLSCAQKSFMYFFQEQV